MRRFARAQWIGPGLALVALALTTAGAPSAIAETVPAGAAQLREVTGTAHMWMGLRLRVKLSAADALGSGVIFGFDGKTVVRRGGAVVAKTAILLGDRVHARLLKGPTGWVAVEVEATATPQSGKAAPGSKDTFGAGGGFGSAGATTGKAADQAAPPAGKAAPPTTAAPSAGTKPAPGATSDLESELGDLGGLGGTTAPKVAPKVAAPNQPMSRSDKVSALIAFCNRSSSRHTSGCEKLRAACRGRVWKGDMLRLCPAIGVRSGGTSSGSSSSGSSSSGTPSYVTSKYRKIAMACRRLPNHETCQKLRAVCRTNHRSTRGEQR